MKLYELKDLVNIDIEGSLERFSNFEPMYIKYLKRFNSEPTFDAFKESIDKLDFEAIETTAHTLKGICGNLGLTDLFNIYNDIVAAIRGNQTDRISQLAQKAIDDTLKYRLALEQLQ